MAKANTSVRLAPFDARLVEIRPENAVAAVREANKLRAEGKVDGVNVFEFIGESLAALAELAPMDRIQLQSCEKIDVAPLYEGQRGLTKLTISSTPVAVELDRFDKLRELRGFWHPKSTGLGSLRHLEKLALWKLDDRFPDVASMGLSTKLKVLWLTQSKVRSLAGIAKLKLLVELQLAHLAGDVDFSELAKVPKLARIKLESVPRHRKLDALGKCSALKDIHLEKCGSVESIHWIRALKNLESFVIVGTRVMDGDFSAVPTLRALTTFSADHRREYRPSIQELEAIVDARSAA